MKAAILLAAGAALMAAGPALAAPDWTVRSPIKVTPASIPDQDGTIVKMVPGASSGRKTAAAAPVAAAVTRPGAKAPACVCPTDTGVVRFGVERRKT